MATAVCAARVLAPPCPRAAARRRAFRWPRWASLLLLACASVPAEAALVSGSVAPPGFAVEIGQFCFNIPENGDNGMVLGTVLPVVVEQYIVFVNQTYPNTPVGCEQILFNSMLTLNFSSATDAMDFEVLMEDAFGDMILHVYAVSCDNHLSMNYVLEFLNPGGYLRQEFSCTEQGLLVIYIVSCAVFGAYVVANVSITPFVARGSQIAKMYRLLSAVVVAQFCSLILMVLHLLVYALNGSGLLLLQWLAQAADAAAQTCLAALLILLARGYGLITGEITHKILFYGVCLLVGLAYMTTFIIQAMSVDLASNIASVFAGSSGAVMIISWGSYTVVWLYWAYRSWSSADDTRKRMWFRGFVAIGAPWMMWLPLIVVVCQLYPDWVAWKRFALSMYQLRNAAALGMLLWLFRGKRLTRVFGGDRGTTTQHLIGADASPPPPPPPPGSPSSDRADAPPTRTGTARLSVLPTRRGRNGGRGVAGIAEGSDEGDSYASSNDDGIHDDEL